MKAKRKKQIEIMDTTLRDGEQTCNLSYSAAEKLHIARILLLKTNVSRIEIASARVSKGEEETATGIFNWAKQTDKNLLSRIEILGFTDNNLSVDWIKKCGGKVINLLTKGSLNHVTNQLKKTASQHKKDIAKTVKYAKAKHFIVNVYLEDWSNGYLHSREYVFDLIEHLISLKVDRLMLPDTLGILYPHQVAEAFTDITSRYPGIHFDFHPQNDYGLGTINVLEALQNGASGCHTTVNCLGERAGNAALAEVIVGIHDHLGYKTSFNEKSLYLLSKVVETFSGKRMALHTPIVGEDVFTHTAGIHADGDKKGKLYDNNLVPTRFGRKRSFALGKMAGKASLDINLKELGIELNDENQKKVLARIIELGDQKHNVTPGDLPFIISDVLNLPVKTKVRFNDVVITSGSNTIPVCSLFLTYKDKEFKFAGSGLGGYDAFMKALTKWADDVKIKLPKLNDYEIRIPPGGKTSALVECKIIWQTLETKLKTESLTTMGVHYDQTLAAVSATEKMLNIILN